MAVCIFHGVVSKTLKCHQGVPQGSVLSSHIFNFFVRGFPTRADVNEANADNFSLTESAPDLDSLGPKLTKHLPLISEWAEDNNLNIAPKKSHITHFTPGTEK
jgi:hypothetical protein